jgi:hypothetical protein
MSAALLQEEECDMEVYLLAFVLTELLVVSVTPRPFHHQEMGGKKVKSSLSLSKYHSRKYHLSKYHSRKKTRNVDV